MSVPFAMCAAQSLRSGMSEADGELDLPTTSQVSYTTYSVWDSFL